MSLFTFTPPFVFHYSVSEHKKIKQNLLTQILSEYENNKNSSDYKWTPESKTKVITNYNEGSRKFYDEFFYKSVIWNSLDYLYHQHQKYFKNKNAKNSQITHIWWNVYQKNDYAELHDHRSGFFDHQKSTLSGVYLLKLNEENNTIFVHRNEISYQKHITDYVKEGDVLLFPSDLYHYVLPAKEERVTISFNVRTEF